MKNKFNIQHLYFYSVCVFAFTLPLLPKLLPPIMILMGLSICFSQKLRVQVKKVFTQKTSLLFILLYLIFVSGMLHTENTKAGLFDLQVKLSILLFPFLLIPFHSCPPLFTTRLLRSFILGCTLSLLICFGLATFNYIQEKIYISWNWYNLNNGFNFFLSSRLSYFIHPSYLAMYLNLGLAALFLYNQPLQLFKNKSFIFIFSLFTVSVVFLSSKAGILALILLLIFFLIVYLKNSGSILKGLLLMGSALLFIGLVYFSAPEFAGKINNAIATIGNKQPDANASESSSARILVWESAVEIIKENSLFGCGTGDSKDQLLSVYEKRGYTTILEKRYNAHNQYLQTTISNGLIGLAALLSIFIYSFYHHSKKRNTLALLFWVLLLINFLFESMLETQAGVMFFSFWGMALLHFDNRK